MSRIWPACVPTSALLWGISRSVRNGRTLSYSTQAINWPLPNQNGAPLRLVIPWKYGFKSIKSIVKIRFVEQQPPTTWNISNAREYGFYSNVNPEVDHPRWSQASERRLGEFFKRKTLPFNGYADQVAQFYAGMDLRKYY